MEVLDWLSRNAGAVNVLVLVAYAIFTLGIWIETHRNALRTKELARQARDAFRMQLVTIYLEETSHSSHPAEDDVYTREARYERIAALREIIQEAFPNEWPDIEQIMCSIGERIVKLYEKEKQPESA